jgi:hypothetical protein
LCFIPIGAITKAGKTGQVINTARRGFVVTGARPTQQFVASLMTKPRANVITRSPFLRPQSLVDDVAGGVARSVDDVAGGVARGADDVARGVARNVDDVAKGAGSSQGTVWRPGEPRPRGWRLPKDGTWDGIPGHSNFIPNNRAALGIAPDAKIPFEGGRPVFSQWKQDLPGLPGSGSFKVTGMTGVHDVDMPLIHKRMSELHPNLFPNQNAAKNWLSQNGITPHHAGGVDVELIPTRLHGAIRHTGGASGLRVTD